jgi:Transcriptional Coactivator p15 (PC4)
MIERAADSLPLPPRLPIVISEWLRNGHDVIRITLDRFNGREVIDIRCWFRDGEGGLRPSRSGMTLAIRHLPLLARGLTEAHGRARVLGLVD